MAERALETPGHFFQHVVRPNVEFFRNNPNSLQAAFNAVLSIDALAGHLFVFCLKHELTELKRDGRFREYLATESDEFRVIRDASNTYKHVSLDNQETLIKRADQTHLAEKDFSQGAYSVGTYGGEEVMIELNDGSVIHCLTLTLKAQTFLENKLKDYGL